MKYALLIDECYIMGIPYFGKIVEIIEVPEFHHEDFYTIAFNDTVGLVPKNRCVASDSIEYLEKIKYLS